MPDDSCPKKAHARLKRALDAWTEATRQAHLKAHCFSEAVENLEFSVNRLGDRCLRYQVTANSLTVEPLRQKSRRLAAIMDRAIPSS